MHYRYHAQRKSFSPVAVSLKKILFFENFQQLKIMTSPPNDKNLIGHKSLKNQRISLSKFENLKPNIKNSQIKTQ